MQQLTDSRLVHLCPAVSGPEMSEALTPDVLKILVSPVEPYRQQGMVSSCSLAAVDDVVSSRALLIALCGPCCEPVQTSGTMRPVVRKKAALCLLRLMRKTPADSQMVTADSFAPIMAQLLEERDLGMLLCCVTLLLGICARCGAGEHGLGCLVSCRKQKCLVMAGLYITLGSTKPEQAVAQSSNRLNLVCACLHCRPLCSWL